MAEDAAGDEAQNAEEAEDEKPVSKQQQQQQQQQRTEQRRQSSHSPPRSKSKKRCNQRIDELATPLRRHILTLWNEHSYHFPKEKLEYLRRLLQELYAMTPEETVKYFNELRMESKAMANRQRMKLKVRRFLAHRRALKQRERAYRKLWRLLRSLIEYALTHEPLQLVSSRLRIISDVVLEQLCEILLIPTVPDRTKPDPLGTILLRLSDWAAVAVESIYFEAQRVMNNCYEYQPRGDSIDFTPETTLPVPEPEPMEPVISRETVAETEIIKDDEKISPHRISAGPKATSSPMKQRTSGPLKTSSPMKVGATPHWDLDVSAIEASKDAAAGRSRTSSMKTQEHGPSIADETNPLLERNLSIREKLERSRRKHSLSSSVTSSITPELTMASRQLERSMLAKDRKRYDVYVKTNRSNREASMLLATLPMGSRTLPDASRHLINQSSSRFYTSGADDSGYQSGGVRPWQNRSIEQKKKAGGRRRSSQR